MSIAKVWVSKKFYMDLGEQNYMLGIQIIHNRENRSITLSQASHIDKILFRFKMQDLKRVFLLF